MQPSSTGSLIVTPIADDLLADPGQLLHLTSMLEWLSGRHASVRVVIPHIGGEIGAAQLPACVRAGVEATGYPPLFLRVSAIPEEATRQVAGLLRSLDDGAPRFVYAPESGGLLAAAAQAKRAGIEFVDWIMVLVPCGIESLRLEQRCEFVHDASSADRELLEHALLRAADTILVETPLQADYVAQLVPGAATAALTLPPPAAFLRSPAAGGPHDLAPDRIAFLGQFTTAGGLEVLASMLQQFTRWKRRLHVKLVGCVGRSAYGDPFQMAAEILAELRHDFEIVQASDPAVLLEALDAATLVVVAERLALRTPLADAARARGVPVLSFASADWIGTWQGCEAESLASRYVVGKAAAVRVRDALAGTHPPGGTAAPIHPPVHPRVHPLVQPLAPRPPAPRRAVPAWAEPAAGRPAAGAVAGICVCRTMPARRGDVPVSVPWPSPHLELELDGTAGSLRQAGRPARHVPSCSLGAVVEAMLAATAGPVLVVATGRAVPTPTWHRHFAALADAAVSHGVVVGDHDLDGGGGPPSPPPRHLLQALWRTAWDAPLVHYARDRLVALARDPRFREVAFSPFALWACASAGIMPLVVPAALSWSPPAGRLARNLSGVADAWRRLQDLTGIADAAGVLPRDLASYIHGIHHGVQRAPDAAVDLDEMPGLADAVARLQEVADSHGRLWRERLARLLAELGRPNAGLIALDQARCMPFAREDPGTVALRAKLEAEIDARALLRAHVAMEVERKLPRPDIALPAAIGLPLAAVEEAACGLLRTYRDGGLWREFNALMAICGRQFGHARAERLRQRSSRAEV